MSRCKAFRRLIISALAVTLLVGHAWADEGGRDARPPAVAASVDTGGRASRPPAEATRGIAGMLEFHASGPMLRAAGDQSRLSPVLVRIASAKPGQDGDVAYRVEFMGLVAGEHDLRDCLERVDGSELNLPPLPIVVHSNLGADHGTDLFLSDAPPWMSTAHYKLVMILLGCLWLSVPIVYLVVRLIRHQAVPPPPPPARPLTLAEQLRPLAEAAIRGSLSMPERARLELLMYLYWRDRLKLEGPQAEVVHRLRRDTQAGVLLRAFEGWLHSGQSPAERGTDELTALLEPYRTVPAIADPEFAQMAGAARGSAGGGR